MQVVVPLKAAALAVVALFLVPVLPGGVAGSVAETVPEDPLDRSTFLHLPPHGAGPGLDLHAAGLGTGGAPSELLEALLFIEGSRLKAGTGEAPPLDAQPTSAAQVPGCLPHPPIRVVGETGPQGLILGHHPVTGAPLYRPGSGVTHGTGSSADPYVIEGWCILGASRGIEMAGIHITGVSTHLRVASNEVHDFEAGILIGDATNVTIQENLLSGNLDNVRTEDTSDLTIRDNLVLGRSQRNGIVAQGGNDLTIDGNTFITSGTTITVGASIKLIGTRDVTVRHNTVESSRSLDTGLRFEATRDTVVHGNTITGVGVSAVVRDAERPIISDNSLYGRVDLELVRTQEATLRNNSMAKGIMIGGDSLLHVQGHVITDNTVGGDPVLYLDGVENLVLGGSMGQLILVDARNVTAQGVEITSAVVAIQIHHSSEVLVRESHLRASVYGIHADRMDNSTIEANDVQDAFFGIFLGGSPENHITGNHITGAFNGITSTLGSNDNQITDNTVDAAFQAGIFVVLADRNIVAHNLLKGSMVGLAVGNDVWGYTFPANHTQAYGNLITDNQYGAAFLSGTDQSFHDNDVVKSSAYGLLNLDTKLPAQDNWWGCPDGPGTSPCGRIEGDIVYAPWRAAPNPLAGPRTG